MQGPSLSRTPVRVSTNGLTRRCSEPLAMPMHTYEVRPRKDHRGVDLISDALPLGRLLYSEPNAISHAIGYAKHRSRSHDAVIRVYDGAGHATHEHAGTGNHRLCFAQSGRCCALIGLLCLTSRHGRSSGERCSLVV
jgi:hypothetical protein